MEGGKLSMVFEAEGNTPSLAFLDKGEVTDYSGLDELSSVERETLEALSKALSINIYVRTRKEGKLIDPHHG
jgi:hypothetical protein